MSEGVEVEVDSEVEGWRGIRCSDSFREAKQNNLETAGRAHVGHFRADEEEGDKSRAEQILLAFSKSDLLVETSLEVNCNAMQA